MQFSLTRDPFLKSLQQVVGALGSRPNLPILNNILLQVHDDHLLITGTDLEVELIAKLPLSVKNTAGATTVPARKFLDICKSFDADAYIQCTLEGERLIIRSGRSRFTLATLPTDDYPNIESWQSKITLTLQQAQLRALIDNTAFSMANQDVRYFLNGMLFEVAQNTLQTVATDGHRMAMSHAELATTLGNEQVIVPRKGVLELTRLLDKPNESVEIQIGASNLRATLNQFTFTSKLIDGRFPDYRRVIPQACNKFMVANCEQLRKALSRIAILSNDKFRGVCLNLTANELRISSQNPEQEEAEEYLDVEYSGEPLEIGFNVSYLMDVLACLSCQQVRFSLGDGTSSSLIEDANNANASYVVMPIRL